MCMEPPSTLNLRSDSKFQNFPCFCCRVAQSITHVLLAGHEEARITAHFSTFAFYMWKDTKRRTDCKRDFIRGQKCLNFTVHVLLGQLWQKQHVMHWKSEFLFTEQCDEDTEGITASALHRQNWEQSRNGNFH